MPQLMLNSPPKPHAFVSLPLQSYRFNLDPKLVIHLYPAFAALIIMSALSYLGFLGPTELHAEEPPLTAQDLAQYLQNQKDIVLQEKSHSSGPSTHFNKEVYLSETDIKNHPKYVEKLLEFSETDTGKSMKSLNEFRQSSHKSGLAEEDSPLTKLKYSRV